MSSVTKRNPITTRWMTPLINGGFVEASEQAHEWRCDGCGLVWDKRNHAQDCEKRGHLAHWEAGPYGVTYVLNGVPQGNLRWYPRDAIRRERVEVQVTTREAVPA